MYIQSMKFIYTKYRNNIWNPDSDSNFEGTDIESTNAYRHTKFNRANSTNLNLF